MDKIEKAFIVKKGFFKEKGFIQRLKDEIKSIGNSTSQGVSNRQVLNQIESIRQIAFATIKSLKVRVETQIIILNTYLEYTRHFPKESLYDWILTELENPAFKQRMSASFVYQSKMMKAEALFGKFNCILGANNNNYNEEDLKLLIKAKYFLISLYVQRTENNPKLSDDQATELLVLLAAILSQLYRWSESFYYLRKIPKQSDYESAFIKYYNALFLREIKNKTCLDYNGLLLLKIIDSASEGAKDKALMEGQREQLKAIEKETRSFMLKNKLKITELRRHKSTLSKSLKKATKSKYSHFVSHSYLYLNEHGFFCNCSQSLKDNIQIKTKHEHTQIDWIKQYSSLLEKIKSDFAVARNEYYFSIDHVSLNYHYLREFNTKVEYKRLYKDSLLLSSFKNCYSILDTIGMAIVASLKKTQKIQLKEGYEGSYIYFLNLWDIFEFKDDILIDNQFLMSLKSIALDLNKTNFAALNKFKSIRNAIEHEMVLITDKKQKFDFNALCIKRNELNQKTEILLNLTKSAIILYTYYFRRLSKIVVRDNIDV